MAGKNQKTIVKLKKLDASAVLPAQATSGAAGFDLVAIEAATIPMHSRAMIRTGIAMEIPPGYEAQVRPRSGMAAKNGVTVLNSPGTIDADYRGEIKVILQNHGPNYQVNVGDKIAQIVIQRVPSIEFQAVDELTSTDRGAAGFGSTGV